MNRTLLTTVMGAAFLIATGIVPMIFEANQTVAAYPDDEFTFT